MSAVKFSEKGKKAVFDFVKNFVEDDLELNDVENAGMILNLAGLQKEDKTRLIITQMASIDEEYFFFFIQNFTRTLGVHSASSYFDSSFMGARINFDAKEMELLQEADDLDKIMKNSRAWIRQDKLYLVKQELTAVEEKKIVSGVRMFYGNEITILENLFQRKLNEKEVNIILNTTAQEISEDESEYFSGWYSAFRGLDMKDILLKDKQFALDGKKALYEVIKAKKGYIVFIALMAETFDHSLTKEEILEYIQLNA